MARRSTKRAVKVSEPDIIQRADPTPEQRSKGVYVVSETANPHEHTEPGVPARTEVCRRVPMYQIIAQRGSYSRETIAVLDWYADRWALACSGLTQDSLAKHMASTGNGLGPGEAAMNARSDCQWARGQIDAGLYEFMAVMHDDKTFEQIGANSYQQDKASRMFKLAASWLLLRCGDKVMVW